MLLFLAYVGNRNWQHKWKNSTFGENFKKGPLQTYLGAFTTDTHYPCMKLMWNDVISVNISYIDNNGTYILCELPDVEEMYNTEEDFSRNLSRSLMNSIRMILVMFMKMKELRLLIHMSSNL